MIKIDKLLLRKNPLSEKIYGSFSLLKEDDAMLFSSIQNEGILEPLIITSSNLVISGNRRLKIALLLLEIKDVPVIYSDVDENSIDEYFLIQYNQQRIKNIIQVAKEFELIQNHFGVKQGRNPKHVTEASKEAQKTLLENNIGSESTIKRVLKTKRLKSKYEKDFNQNDSWTDDDSWEWMHTQHTERKKEVNTILISLEEQLDEIKNVKRAKEIELQNDDYVKIIHGDSSDLSEYLGDEEIDCIPNSPPYFAGVRTYLDDKVSVKSSKKGLDQIGHEKNVDDYLNNLMKTYRECKRVLKQDGSIFINIADSYVDGELMNIPGKLIELMKTEKMHCIQTIVWFKINPIYFSNDKVFQPSMEYILHFVKDKKKYKWFNDWFGKEDKFLGNITYGKNDSRRFRNTMIYYPTNSNSEDIHMCQGLLETTSINNHYLVKLLRKKGFELQHNALFPLEVPMVCILSTTEPGDTILDVFGGMSTTGLIAIAHGCKYYGFDRSKVYSAKATIRIKDFLENNPHLKPLN